MKTSRKELLAFAETNPRFVTEAITEATNGEDFSEYTTEEVILEHLDINIVEELVKRFRLINSKENNV